MAMKKTSGKTSERADAKPAEMFDYAAAVAELEKIASTVENPETPIDDIDKYIRRSEKLIADCRAWLRGVRERTLNIDGGLS